MTAGPAKDMPAPLCQQAYEWHHVCAIRFSHKLEHMHPCSHFPPAAPGSPQPCLTGGEEARGLHHDHVHG